MFDRCCQVGQERALLRCSFLGGQAKGGAWSVEVPSSRALEAMPRDVMVAAAAFTPAPQNQLAPTACAATTQGLDCFPRKRAGMVVFIVLELGYRHHVRVGGPGGNSQNTHGIAMTPAMAFTGLVRKCFNNPQPARRCGEKGGVGGNFQVPPAGEGGRRRRCGWRRQTAGAGG